MGSQRGREAADIIVKSTRSIGNAAQHSWVARFSIYTLKCPRDGDGRMNRRQVVLTAGAVIAFPARAQVDPATAAALAEAALAIYKQISEMRSGGDNRRALSDIRQRLNDISVKIDRVIDLLELLPEVFQSILYQHDQAIISQELLSKGVLIVDQVAAAGTRKPRGGAYATLNKEAVEQSQLRERIAATYGAGVYPLIAQGFMSEAVAYRALRDQKNLFEIQKKRALAQLRFAAEHFAGLADKQSALAKSSREIWGKHIPLTQVASGTRLELDAAAVYAHPVKYVFVSYVDGTYESGVVRQDVSLRDMVGSNIQQYGNLPTSPFVNMSIPARPQARHDTIFETLRSATEQGRLADSLLPKLREHAEAARKLADAVDRVAY